MTVYGYARVSTQGQNLDGQVEQLTAFGIDKVYSEKFTGTTTDRPIFKRLIRRLNKGDTLVVVKLDRFARTVADGIKLIDKLTEKGIKVHVLNIGLLDDSVAGRLLRNIMLAFAEFERDMIVDRLAEGKARARLMPGYKEGRPKRKITKKYKQAYCLLETRSFREVENLTGISKSTLVRIRNQIEHRR
jgi:DNA invertase Pin-like site-specific DNA recombinase